MIDTMIISIAAGMIAGILLRSGIDSCVSGYFIRGPK